MAKSKRVIRSTRHTTKFANTGKREELSRFLDAYQSLGQAVLDEIWGNGYDNFSVAKDGLELPKYLDYNRFAIDTKLSARAQSSLMTQLSGVIRAATEKRRRMLWLRAKLVEEGENVTKLDEKLRSRKFTCVKPRFPRLAELSSKCAKLEDGECSFDYVLALSALGKGFAKTAIPLQKTKNSVKWEKRGERLGSFLITERNVEIRWELAPASQFGESLGADQGMKTVLTFSNGVTTPQCCPHGHSLDSICDKIARRRKGSKGFRRATAHRKNFVHYSVNRLNFADIGEVKLEEVVNINHGKRSTRKMRAWTNTEIRDKVIGKCEELGVQVTMQNCTYRSQRCSDCGNVRKANRKGKFYFCKHCGNAMDADLNAARNLALDLPDVSLLRGRKMNLKLGFFWKPEGIFDYDGREIGVPDSTASESSEA